jgi:hypothetical protein
MLGASRHLLPGSFSHELRSHCIRVTTTFDSDSALLDASFHRYNDKQQLLGSEV